MRVILITDSHGKGMGQEMTKIDNDLEIMTISVGEKSSIVWSQVEAESDDIWKFWPEVFLIHLGHNDVVWNPKHNRQPLHPQEVFSLLLGKVQKLRDEYPGCRILVSNMFPRTVGPYFPMDRKGRYNMMVYQYGKTMREQLPSLGIEVILNGILWFKPSQGREYPIFLKPDGLHLSDVGKNFVAGRWVQALRRGRREAEASVQVQGITSISSQRATTD